MASTVVKVNVPLAATFSAFPPLSSSVTEAPVLNPETVPPIVKSVAAAGAYIVDARATRQADTALNTLERSMRIRSSGGVTSQTRSLWRSGHGKWRLHLGSSHLRSFRGNDY